MNDFFEFVLYVVQQLVQFLFALNLGLGFSVGDLIVALMVTSVIGSALVLRVKK